MAEGWVHWHLLPEETRRGKDRKALGVLNNTIKNLCIFHIADGLSDGISHFSGPSRAALVYAESPDTPIRIFDPQKLLDGHQPKLKELYLTSREWCTQAPDTQGLKSFGHIHPEKNLGLAGLISCGGRTRSIFYQMWFTEHHPDMCSIGPTERWLEHAVCLLAHDFSTEDASYTGMSRYVLREYATHAVRDYIMDELNIMFGWDTGINVYPTLDAILGISKTKEEGARPSGMLLFVAPDWLPHVDFLVRFPARQQPGLTNFKHVRKLLLSVESSEHRLVSDGHGILGIATGEPPECRITADFRDGYGFLRLAGSLVCSFADGSFHSTTHRPKLYQLEEALLESKVDPSSSHILLKIVTAIVHKAAREKHGCTLVIDLNPKPMELSGQLLEQPVDLRKDQYLSLAKALAKMDGALHIGCDLHLHAFGCLLDGRSVPGENRARGARFNSALRFTSENDQLIVVVVSSDRPVSVIQGGVELTSQCRIEPASSHIHTPITLEQWVNSPNHHS